VANDDNAGKAGFGEPVEVTIPHKAPELVETGQALHCPVAKQLAAVPQVKVAEEANYY
jgi:hypothetical protein